MKGAAAARALMLEGYIDGYFRIRETTPLILLTIEAFNRRKAYAPARFWTRNLKEEFAHDEVAHRDLLRLHGDSAEALAHVLDSRSISPPCAAMLGYFEWQIRKGDPHYFMVYKLFLEQHAVEAHEGIATMIKVLGQENTRCLAMHQELDQGHLAECTKYIDRYFDPARLADYLWAIDFIGDCLTQSQVWNALRLLSK